MDVKRQLRFLQSASAGSATITTNSGGYVLFDGTASGGTARFIFNGSGYLDISNETAGTLVGRVKFKGVKISGRNMVFV